MLTVHHANAFLVIAVCVASAAAALLARRRGAKGGVAHLLALAQTLLVAQVGVGLILLAEHKHAAEKLHYAYGAFAVLAAFAPWLYAPADPRSRLAWFAGATLVAAALAARAYMTA
jgi:hypothetical protein